MTAQSVRFTVEVTDTNEVAGTQHCSDVSGALCFLERLQRLVNGKLLVTTNIFVTKQLSL